MSNPSRRQPVPAGASAPSSQAAASATPDTGASGEAANGTSEAGNGDPTTPAPPSDGQIEARALIAFEGYNPNDVVIVAESEVEALQGAGKIDPHPDAVAYAKSLADD